MPPIDDFGFVDLETMSLARDEARRITNRAVDVEYCATTSADQVVVVVAHPTLITR